MVLRRRTYLGESFKKGRVVTKKMIDIYHRDGIDVDGYVDRNIGIYKGGKSGWNVLHLPSGFDLERFDDLKKAKLFGEYINNIIGSDEDKDTISSGLKKHYDNLSGYLSHLKNTRKPLSFVQWKKESQHESKTS